MSEKDELKVQQATGYETTHIMNLLVEMHSDLESSKHPIDFNKSASYITWLIETGAIFIAVKGGKCVGAIGLNIESAWWSQAQEVVDSFFFVAKDHRKGGEVATALIKTAVEKSEKIGLNLALGHQLSQLDRQEAKDKFYENLGFKKVGSIFVKEVVENGAETHNK